MSSFLCFICHSPVNNETNEETREKYREVVGMYLCPDSHLCYICCHILNKLFLFRSICLKRSLEYPVLFSEKGTLYLQRSDLEIHVLCLEECLSYQQKSNCKSYVYIYNNINDNAINEYAKLEEDNEFYPTDNEKNGLEYKCEEKAVHDSESYDGIFELHNDNVDFDPKNHDENIESDTDISTQIEQNNVENNKCQTDIPVQKKIKKRSKRKCYKKINLSVDEQKAVLEASRRAKKYIEAEYKCYNCALSFLFKDTYQTHMMRHEESNGEHQCPTCTLRFATQALLRVHTSNHTERYKCTKCLEIMRPKAKRTHACFQPKETQEIACHLCGNLFKDANGLQQHLRRVHSTTSNKRMTSCGVCGERYSGQALRTHMLKHIKKKFPCDQCMSTFSSPYTLTQHKKKHTTPADVHYCTTCGLSYNSRKSLLAHRRNSVNHQMNMLECGVCGRACPGRRALALHSARVHEGRAEHACALCPARYSTRGGLARHVSGHKNQVQAKVAICHLCGNNFKNNNKLNRHLKEVCEKTRIEEQLSTLYQ